MSKTYRILGAFMLALLYGRSVQAAPYYWDANGAADGFGTAGGTWGTDSYWNNSNTGGSGTFGTTITTSDTGYFGTDAASYGLGAGTINVGTVNAGSLYFGSQSGAIDLSGGTITLGAASTITVNNASNNISSVLAGAATSLTKAGAGTLTLSGANTFTNKLIINTGTVTLNGTGANTGGGAITVGGVNGQTGVLNINSGSLALGGNTLGVGNLAGATGIVNQTGGTITNNIQLGYASGGTIATYNMSGGAINLTGGTDQGICLGHNGGASSSYNYSTFNFSGGNIDGVTTAASLTLGRQAAAKSYTSNTWNQSGGTANFHYLNIAPHAAASNITANFSVTGGTFSVDSTSSFVLGLASNSTVLLTIGGTAQVTLKAFPTNRAVGTTATITFDQTTGYLQPRAASTSYLEGMTHAYLTRNGLRFDTTNLAVTINQGLEDAADSNGALTKLGSGTLTLGGTSTYSGTTAVSNGVVKLAATGSISNSPICVSSGATFDVSAWSLGYTLGSGQILSGSGTVTGSVVVASGAGIAGGVTNTVGVLSMRSGLTLQAGAKVYCNYNATTSDTVRVTGTLTLEGANTVVVSAVEGATALPVQQTLFTFGSLVGGSNLSTWSVEGASGYITTLTTNSTSVLLNATVLRAGTIVFLR